MGSPNLLSGTVMDAAASLQNDTAKTSYTYAAQVPYLNMALLSLQEIFELNEVPIVDTVSAVMTVPAGVDFIGFSPTPPVVGTPYLPSNLIEPQKLWERPNGTNPYIPMTKVDDLPKNLEGILQSQFIWYTWQSQEIRFLPSGQINQIKMDYIRNLFVPITLTTGLEELYVINGQSYLQFQLGGLLAEFIGENTTRANKLYGFADLAVNRALGIGTKGRQGIITRRRPFRSSYKRQLAV